MTEREQRIRERAHELWDKAGQPSGRDNEFWEHAEREIDTETDRSRPPQG